MAKKNDLRDVAQTLFMQGYSQKEIAKKLGKVEQTVSRWSKEGNWKTKKTNILTSKDSRLSELYEELAEFNRMIKSKEGFKVATHTEALVRRMLVNDIVSLETLKAGVDPAQVKQLQDKKRKEVEQAILNDQA